MQNELSQLSLEELIEIAIEENRQLEEKYKIKHGFELNRVEVNEELAAHYLNQFRNYATKRFKVRNINNPQDVITIIEECRAEEEKMKMEFLNIVPPIRKKLL